MMPTHLSIYYLAISQLDYLLIIYYFFFERTLIFLFLPSITFYANLGVQCVCLFQSLGKLDNKSAMLSLLMFVKGIQQKQNIYINNGYNYNKYWQMDDDDIMLNISTSKNKQRKDNQAGSTERKISKTDIKKNKYANKMKMRNKSYKSKDARTHKQQATLFGNLNDQQTHKEEEHAPTWQKRTKRTFPKIQENQVKTQQNNSIPQKKRQYKQERTSFRERQNRKTQSQQKRGQNNSQFKPGQRKDVTVEQLMPQKSQQKNYIDNSQLSSFNIESKIKDSLQRSGVAKLTQIQNKSFQSLVNGVDSVIKASTGSGKTLAYLIPLINRLLKNSIITKREDGTCILIICPTRELCVQGQKQANRCLKRCPFIISGNLYGGEETNHEKSRLRKGTNILFCTPGRVLYHLQHTKCFKLDNLQAIVFEEADRTLDMGFHDTIKKMLKIISDKVALSKIHKILVSAHFNSKVSSLIEQLEMGDSQFIGFQNVNSDMKLQNLKQSKDVQINASIHLKQQYVLTSQQQKIPLMLAYLSVLKHCKALIFVSTIDEVQFFDYLFTNLKYRDSNGNETETKFENRPVFKIHGNLDQKLRTKTYLSFRQSKEAILISTQVASRGLDFPDLSHIILYDVPPTITDYGNRVGRSARFNQTGVSLLMLHYIESDYAETIRFYAPNLQVLDKDVIYESFEKILKSMNIGDQSLHYIQGLVRTSVKNDDEKYTVARKAYVSMLKAYARLPDRHIFAVKKLNLKLLARSFGLNNAQADNNYNPKAKSSFLEASRKKRKVQSVKKLQFSQYM